MSPAEPLTRALACPQVYKQKVKHLLHEQQENLTELKAEGVLSLRRAQKDHWDQEQELWKEKHSLNIKLKEQEVANEAAITNLSLVCPWLGWNHL